LFLFKFCDFITKRKEIIKKRKTDIGLVLASR